MMKLPLASRLTHPENTLASKSILRGLMTTFESLAHLLNAFGAILLMFELMTKLVMDLQFSKHRSPRSKTEFGSSIDTKFEQPMKANFPISRNCAGESTPLLEESVTVMFTKAAL
jgi:hypothetical protein